MRFISWNVNGLRACMQKGFPDFFDKANADFFCLQETKLQEGQIHLDLPGYEQYWCYAEKKGYSGTAIFTKHTPMDVRYGIGIAELDTEGRVITLEYPEFFLVTCYTPNAQRELARIDHRMKWEDAFRAYLKNLDKRKPVILCGDLNVAHKEIDLKNPASNRGSAGFSDQERQAFGKLLDSGFTDTFRHLHPDTTGAYTWWSYMFNARKNNAGWRIDYFLVSDRLKYAIHATPIHSDVMGSDHCPVELDLGVPCNGGIWFSSEKNTSEAEQHAIEETKEKEPGKVPSLLLKSAAVVGCLSVFLIFGLWLLNQNSSDFSHWLHIEPGSISLTREYELAGFLTESNQIAVPFRDGDTVRYIVYQSSLFSSSPLAPEDADWCIRLDLSLYGKTKWMLSDTFFLIARRFSPIYDSIDQIITYQASGVCTVAPWYTNAKELGGFYIYGSGYQFHDLKISINSVGHSTNPSLSYIPTERITESTISIPYEITAEKAANMSTQELAEYVVYLPELISAGLTDSDKEFEQAYLSALEKHPALKQMQTRSNSAIILQQYTTQSSYRPSSLPCSWMVAEKILELPPEISGIEIELGYIYDDIVLEPVPETDFSDPSDE